MNLRPLLCEKLQLKLLSLLFAVLLWLFVTMESGGEMDVPLSVGFVNIPAGMTVRDVSPPRLQVRISGARILLLRQKLRGATAYVDLSGTRAGRLVVSGMERFVRLDDGLRAQSVSPGSLVINLVNSTSADVR